MKEEKMNKKLKGMCTSFLLALFLLAGCGKTKETIYQYEPDIKPLNDSGAESAAETLAQEESAQVQEGLKETEESKETEKTKETEEPKEYDIQLMMVGDNLMHMGIVRTGKQEDGSYNYDFLFTGIEDFLEEAEIKMINQETILGGNHLGFSGFPYFNSPTEVGDAIAGAGFNVVLHASNHAADKQVEGLVNCIEFWTKYPEMTVAGIHGKGDSPIQIMTIDGIDFAILNYTYGPNVETIPEDIQGYMNVLCNYDESTGRMDYTTLHPDVLTDIAEAKEMADVVIVCPHWGTEYTTEPSSYQQKFARQLTEAGADIIIGTHPHVVQPVEWIEGENGNRALCFYSLGNYVSTQKEPLCMLEAMAWVNFHVTEDGISIDKEKTGVVPMVCHYTAGPVRLESVYLLEDYTEEKAASHGIRSYGGVELYLSDLHTWSREVFGENVLTAQQVLAE
ncbi:MAG: CapA family protein [Lachnospiraceae bacterium]|nr:CapA family protein [Lachnospiraceae bacterium]